MRNIILNYSKPFLATFSVLIILFIIPLISAGTWSSNLEDGLVAYYNFSRYSFIILTVFHKPPSLLASLLFLILLVGLFVFSFQNILQ